MEAAAAEPAAPSLAWRALLAVVLTVVFYAFALGLGAAMVGVPIWLWATGQHFNIWLSLFMVFTGGSILLAIVPRRIRFEGPGPRLDRSAEPRLFEEIAAVAQATGQPVPEEVYLDGERRVEPFAAFNDLAAGERRLDDWRASCERAGIADVPLSLR